MPPPPHAPTATATPAPVLVSLLIPLFPDKDRQCNGEG